MKCVSAAVYLAAGPFAGAALGAGLPVGAGLGAWACAGKPDAYQKAKATTATSGASRRACDIVRNSRREFAGGECLMI